MNRSLRRRAETRPSTTAAQFFSQAVKHQLAGDLAEACEAYKNGLTLQPGHVDAHYGLGLALQGLGHIDQAIDSYRAAVVHGPRHAWAYNNLALLLKQRGDLDDAEAASLKSLEIDPASPVFLGNLGTVLMDRNDLDRAVAAFQKALASDPGNVVSLANLCMALRRQGKILEAIAAGRSAIALQPDSIPAQTNLATALSDNGEVEESLMRFRLALNLDPEMVDVHMILALAALSWGNFELGWSEYEWRWRQRDFAWIEQAGLSTAPKWTGEPLTDKVLMICAEQGLGDTIQFIRYLPLVLARARRVKLWVQPALKALLRNVEGVTLLGMNENAEGFAVYCPLMSLPRVFATTPQTIPPVVPYFHADRADVERWRTRLGQEGRLRVGICWQGKPGAEVDRGRSIPLAAFAPLARIPGVRLISLQKNFGAEQLANLPEGMNVETLGEDFDARPRAFLDTAAVLETLDLVVTSDTAIAHLAASLGRPTWMALQRIADWRWGIGQTHSPWYPSMRLFRQSKAGDWEGVFQEIAEALAAWIDGASEVSR
jgi:tetratricopeptide (TPR) repeat protein